MQKNATTRLRQRRERVPKKSCAEFQRWRRVASSVSGREPSAAPRPNRPDSSATDRVRSFHLCGALMCPARCSGRSSGSFGGSPRPSRNCPRDIPGPLLDVCIRMQRRGFDSSARGYTRRPSPSFRGGGGWPRPPASMAYMPRLRPGTRAFALALAHHGSLLSLTLPSRVRNHTSTLPKVTPVLLARLGQPD